MDALLYCISYPDEARTLASFQTRCKCVPGLRCCVCELTNSNANENLISFSTAYNCPYTYDFCAFCEDLFIPSKFNYDYCYNCDPLPCYESWDEIAFELNLEPVKPLNWEAVDWDLSFGMDDFSLDVNLDF